MATPLEQLRAKSQENTSTKKALTPLEVYRQTHPVQPSALDKVGAFVKPVAQDLYKTAVTIPVRGTQAVAAVVGDASVKNPELRKKAFEYASQPVNIGFGTQVKPLDTSSVTAATKQTAGDILKTASLTNIGSKLTLAKQAALQGGMYMGGSALEENKTPLEILRETAIGGATGLVGGKVLSKVFGKGAKVAEKIDNTVPTNTPDAPTAPIVDETLQKEILDEMNTRKVSNDNVVPDTKVVPDTTPVSPEVTKATPKPVTYTKDPVQSLSKVLETELPPNTDPTFINTTLANQTAKYDSVAAVNSTDDLIDMAMGLKPAPEGLNPVSIHALTSIRKDLTVEQAIRLKNIYPLSQAGQDLSLARLKSGAIIDNPVDMMQAVEKSMKEEVIKKGISKNDIKNLFPDCAFN